MSKGKGRLNEEKERTGNLMKKNKTSGGKEIKPTKMFAILRFENMTIWKGIN